MQQQLEQSSGTIPEIQLPVLNRFTRNFLNAMAVSLTSRGHAPGVLVVPEKDRHELHSAMKLLAHIVAEDTEPVFMRSDADFVEYVFDESHHRPVMHLNAENISLEMQQRAVDYWSHASMIRPPVTIFVVQRDPGDILNEGIWLKPFREMMHMPTFRWPESPTVLKSPKHRLGFFLDVFQHVAGKIAVGTELDAGARDFLLEQFFSRFKPRYTGNYVKLAADLITEMRKVGESKITTKVVLTLTDPGHEFALG